MEQIINDIKMSIQTDAYRVFYLYTFEEDRTLRVIKDIAKEKLAKIYQFDISSGLTCENDKRIKHLPTESVKDLNFTLRWLEANASGFVVFKDINSLLENDPMLLRAFKNFIKAIEEKNLYIKVFIISSSPNLPQDLQYETFFIDVPLPSRKDIEHIVDSFAMMIGQKMSSELKEEFINSLQGMREADIVNILKYCIHDGKLTEKDLKLIVKVKKQIIKKDNIIEFVDTTSGIDSVGGMKELKKWLARKGMIIRNLDKAVGSYVDIPKGILLFGMPGCGKSLVSKAIAYEWHLPLLRLDIGMILGPYVGQSEENIRRAIKIAESISPCILWIDELEKGFSGIKDDGGGGVMKRVFGSFLTWMQEKTKPVFVVATANNIGDMPPEFLRKGRFDEIFYVDFPSEEARVEILKIHLKKRNKEEWFSTLEPYAKNMKNFAGSDIEAVVSELVERHFINTLNNGVFDLKKEIENILKEFKPLSETMKDQTNELRNKLKSMNAKSVD